MARIGIIDSQTSGISGDMLLSSLVDMNGSQRKIKEAIFECETFLPGSKIKNVDFIKSTSRGFAATYLKLEYIDAITHRKGMEMHRSLARCCDSLGLDQQAKTFALETFKTILAAEAIVHGIQPDEVYLAETSSIDTFADLIGCSLALQDSGLFGTRFLSTRVAVGGGMVSFSHGAIANPSSAILEIFKGKNFVLFGGQAEEEMTTPTGAALLTNLATESISHYPSFSPTMIGHGSGLKTFDHPNILRIAIGETSFIDELRTESNCLVETVVDDVSGEVLGNLIEQLTDDAVRDIMTLPGIAKKNRPTNLIRIICDHSKLNNVLTILFNETGTLGARVQDITRVVRPRSVVTTMVNIAGIDFKVRVKITKGSDAKIVGSKAEFNDLKEIAQKTGLPLRKVLELVSAHIALKISEI